MDNSKMRIPHNNLLNTKHSPLQEKKWNSFFSEAGAEYQPGIRQTGFQT